jgi:FlgD Ig-like domain
MPVKRFTPLFSLAATLAPPRETALHANQPNPFNPSTTIQYSLSRTTPVRLVIYDVSGRLVRSLVDAVQAAGDRQVTWDGRDSAGNAVGSGMYLYRLEAGETVLTRKMSLLK